MPTLAILCPVYNEEEVVPLFFGRMKPVMDRLAARYDVDLIFLNNCSGDGTMHAVQRLIADNDRIYLLTMSRNVGYQRSIERGLRTIEADLYTIIDVDCEDPPEMIADFVARFEQGYDVVYGQRVDREEPRLLKQVRRLFYRLLRAFADEDIILDMAEFSLFTRKVRDAILDENTSFPFLRASIARVGFRRAAIPFKRHKRIAGRTHYNVVGMSIFAVAGILASSTLLLRLPIYLFPAWVASLALLCGLYAANGSRTCLALAILEISIYLGATAAVTALYVARTYKNGLIRPNAFLDDKNSILPRPARSAQLAAVCIETV